MSDTRTVWYYSKWDMLFVRCGQLLWCTDNGVTISFHAKDIKSWKNFTYLGEL